MVYMGIFIYESPTPQKLEKKKKKKKTKKPV